MIINISIEENDIWDLEPEQFESFEEAIERLQSLQYYYEAALLGYDETERTL